MTETLDRTCAPFFAAFRLLWLPTQAPGQEGVEETATPSATPEDDAHEGGRIYFATEDEGDIPLYRVAGDGSGEPQRIITGARQVTGVSAVPGAGVLAITVTDAVTPAEVAVCALDGTGERRLTDLNREWKGEVSLSVPERFRYDRAGYTLDGWVMKPFGFQAGRRYPLLLNIHGGPATQYGHAFFDEFQVYAGAGYVVLFTNPRGSQGYGEGFTRSIIRDWGGGDYEDVMAGLDEALRRYDFVDPDRMGVLGGSYGGFMTTWVVGHTDRFRAACSERALNDHASFFGTSDIGFTFSEDYAGTLPWEDWEWYVQHSPLTYAPRITTPLLIMHAENDLRCPIGQAEQLFVALKKLGREATFVRFPDEGHELSRSGKPRHRLERFRLLLDWFGGRLRTAAGGEGAKA